MHFPVLIAQTPRAGRWNHLNLLPRDEGLPGELNAADYLGSASSHPVGGNYLAAIRLVSQQGTSKEGREVLALVGLEVPDGRRREEVLDWLNSKLDDLDVLVKQIDWSTHDGSDYVVPEFDRWRQEVVTRFNLKAPRVVLKPATALRRHRRTWQVRMLLATAIVVCLSGIAFLGFGNQITIVDRPDAFVSVPPQKSAERPRQKDNSAAMRCYREMIDDVLGKIGPEILATEAGLRSDLAVALDGLGKWSKPEDFDKMRQDEQERLLLRSTIFSDWLRENYPERKAAKPSRYNPFLGDIDEGTKTKLRAPRWNLKTPRDAYESLKWAHELNEFLRECKALGHEALKEQLTKPQQQAAPLLAWLRDLRNDFDVQIVGVPFVIPSTAKQLQVITGKMESLSRALQIELGQKPDELLFFPRISNPDGLIGSIDKVLGFERNQERKLAEPNCPRWAIVYAYSGTWDVSRHLYSRIRGLIEPKALKRPSKQ